MHLQHLQRLQRLQPSNVGLTQSAEVLTLRDITQVVSTLHSGLKRITDLQN